MTKGLIRHYGRGHLHFITFSCYRRRPLLRSVRMRNIFIEILSEVRDRYGFSLVGYVVKGCATNQIAFCPRAALSANLRFDIVCCLNI